MSESCGGMPGAKLLAWPATLLPSSCDLLRVLHSAEPYDGRRQIHRSAWLWHHAKRGIVNAAREDLLRIGCEDIVVECSSPVQVSELRGGLLRSLDHAAHW